MATKKLEFVPREYEDTSGIANVGIGGTATNYIDLTDLLSGGGESAVIIDIKARLSGGTGATEWEIAFWDETNADLWANMDDHDSQIFKFSGISSAMGNSLHLSTATLGNQVIFRSGDTTNTNRLYWGVSQTGGAGDEDYELYIKVRRWK